MGLERIWMEQRQAASKLLSTALYSDWTVLETFSFTVRVRINHTILCRLTSCRHGSSPRSSVRFIIIQ
jgi:hypothetical protein